jgi:hypothetical protein
MLLAAWWLASSMMTSLVLRPTISKFLVNLSDCQLCPVRCARWDRF